MEIHVRILDRERYLHLGTVHLKILGVVSVRGLNELLGVAIRVFLGIAQWSLELEDGGRPDAFNSYAA